MQLLAVLRETLFAAFFYFFWLSVRGFLALLGRNPEKIMALAQQFLNR